MSSPKQQQSTTGGLNPTMVYRPLTPPVPGSSYLGIDEPEDPKFRFRVRVAWIARAILASLTLGSAIAFIADEGSLARGSKFAVGLFVLLWFVLVWQVVQLGRAVWSGRGGKKGCLPRISLQIGDAGCVLGGEGGGHGGRLVAFVDLAFGVTVITIGGEFGSGFGAVRLLACVCGF